LDVVIDEIGVICGDLYAGDQIVVVIALGLVDFELGLALELFIEFVEVDLGVIESALFLGG
jgi:hypothetical protein